MQFKSIISTNIGKICNILLKLNIYTTGMCFAAIKYYCIYRIGLSTQLLAKSAHLLIGMLQNAHSYLQQHSPQLCSHIIHHCPDKYCFYSLLYTDLWGLNQCLLGVNYHVCVLTWLIVLLHTVKPSCPAGDSAECENDSGCQQPSDHSGQSLVSLAASNVQSAASNWSESSAQT